MKFHVSFSFRLEFLPLENIQVKARFVESKHSGMIIAHEINVSVYNPIIFESPTWFNKDQI